MQARSPNRPPRRKRPPEVVRHVNETLEAYRRLAETRKEARPPEEKPRAGEPQT